MDKIKERPTENKIIIICETGKEFDQLDKLLMVLDGLETVSQVAYGRELKAKVKEDFGIDINELVD